MNDSIKNICVKYLMNEANIEELNVLENWLKKPKNKQFFANYLNLNYAMNMNMNPFDKESAKIEFLEKIRQAKRSYKRRLYRKFSYAAAASVILIATLTIFLNNGKKITKIVEPVIVNNNIKHGMDKATLTLEDGKEVILVDGASFQTPNATSNGEEIIYAAGKRRKTEIAYNTLTIPRGGQFFVKLSDGTQVWLNSETQLKYPINFINGEIRQVELVYGEAYFDVSSSTEHKGSNFKVYNQSQEVEVLGTEFNIKAYKDETNIYTTLVEGKVSIQVGTQNKILLPEEQSNLDKTLNSVVIKNVDIKSEVSWRNGIYIFRNKSLKEIMKTLSRWYDMDVVFENKELENIQFIGTLNKKQDIVDILNDIKNFGVIKDYEINNKEVILR